MTSILFVGDLNPFCRSEQRCRGLSAIGCAVDAVSFTPVDPARPDGPPPTMLDRVRHRLGRPGDPAAVNEAILERVAARRYDVLWVDKAPCLRPETLRAARHWQPEIKLVFNSEDDMFARHNQSRYFRRCLPLYDVVFTAKSYNAAPDELPSLGARNVHYRPQAYDPDYHHPVPVDDDDRRELGADVGFIGSYEAERAASLLHLAENGVPVRVFGNGWGAFAARRPHPGLRIERRPLYGEEFVKSLCTTAINLGFLRKANRDLHTSRSVEIPACGAFLLAERTGEHEALFEEGFEAEFFGDDDELLEKARRYLAEPELARKVARAGRARCISSGYSLHDSLAAMREVIEREVPCG